MLLCISHLKSTGKIKFQLIVQEFVKFSASATVEISIFTLWRSMSQCLVSQDYHNNFLCDNFHFVKLLQWRRGREQDDDDGKDENERTTKLQLDFLSLTAAGRDTSTKWNVTRFHYQNLWLVDIFRWMKKFPSTRKNEPRQQWEFFSFFLPFSQSLHFTSLDMPTFSGHLKLSLFVSSSLAGCGNFGDIFNFLTFSNLRLWHIDRNPNSLSNMLCMLRFRQSKITEIH